MSPTHSDSRTSVRQAYSATTHLVPPRKPGSLTQTRPIPVSVPSQTTSQLALHDLHPSSSEQSHKSPSYGYFSVLTEPSSLAPNLSQPQNKHHPSRSDLMSTSDSEEDSPPIKRHVPRDGSISPPILPKRRPRRSTHSARPQSIPTSSLTTPGSPLSTTPITISTPTSSSSTRVTQASILNLDSSSPATTVSRQHASSSAKNHLTPVRPRPSQDQPHPSQQQPPPSQQPLPTPQQLFHLPREQVNPPKLPSSSSQQHFLSSQAPAPSLPQEQQSLSNSQYLTIRTCSPCGKAFKSRNMLSAHLRSYSHMAFNICNVPSTDLSAMGFVLCNSCLKPFPISDKHLNSCHIKPSGSLSHVFEMLKDTTLVATDQSKYLSVDFIESLTPSDIFGRIIPTFRSIPDVNALRKALAMIFDLCAHGASADATRSLTFFKLFLLIPRLILIAPAHHLSSSAITDTIARRIQLFCASNFDQLFKESCDILSQQTGSLDRSSHQPIPESQQVSRATMFVRQGLLHRAMQALAPSHVLADPNSLSTQNNLDKVFPSDEPLPPCTDAPPQALNAAQVAEAVRSSTRGSGAGVSGLRMDHLFQLLPHGVANSLTFFLNMLHGRQLPSDYMDALRTGAATLFQKSETAVRPIVVLETIIRVWSRVVVNAEQAHLASHLFPHQFGVKTKGGVFQVPTIVNLLQELRPSDTTLMIDLSNAYGSVSRHYLLDLLNQLDQASQLRHYFTTIYGNNINVLSRGAAHAIASKGLIQGDPIAPLLFCLGIHKQLAQAATHLPDGTLLAYLDDITFVGPAAQVQAAFEDLQPSLHYAGLSINKSKCKLLPHSVFTPALELGVPLADGPIKLLGTPLYPNSEPTPASLGLTDVAQASLQLVRKVSTLPSAQMRLVLLRHCIQARLLHLARTADPDFTSTSFEDHDFAIVKAIRDMMNHPDLPPVDVSSTLADNIGLPLSMGGLGLRPYGSTSHLLAFAAFIESMSAALHRFPHLAASLQQFASHNGRLHSRMTHAAQLAHELNPAFGIDLLQNPPSDARKLQSTLMAAFDTSVFNRLLQTYKDSASKPSSPGFSQALCDIRRLLSTSSPMAMAAFAAIPSDHRLKVADNNHFAIILRRVFGCPLLPPKFQGLPCACGKQLSDLHVQVCTHSYDISKRHHGIRDLLATAFRHTHLSAVCEPQLAVGQLRWDIKVPGFSNPTSLDFFDVTVTHPCQLKYLVASNLEPLKPAADAVQAKYNKYMPYLPFQPLGSTFCPLAFESFGSCHDDVLRLLYKLNLRAERRPPASATWASNTFAIFFAQALSLRIHLGTAIVIAETIARCHSVFSEASGLTHSA